MQRGTWGSLSASVGVLTVDFLDGKSLNQNSNRSFFYTVFRCQDALDYSEKGAALQPDVLLDPRISENPLSFEGL